MNKKKIIIIVACAVVALALVITGVIFFLKGAFTAKDGKENTSSASSVSDYVGEAEITVGDVEGTVGGKVKVPVTIKGNPGFMAGMLSFKFDTDSLKYVTYYKGDFLTDYSIDCKDGIISFVGVENEDVKKDGLLFELEFEIAKNAKTSEITLNSEKASMLCNFDEQRISVKCNSGSVTVK